MLQTDTRDHTEFREQDEGGGLIFQRCLWCGCGTPAYRRSYCRACGSRALKRERSPGAGVVVRRNGPVPHNTWFVAMDEGFTLVCQITRTAPIVVSVGARVKVVQAVDPDCQGLPVVELTLPAAPLERWW
ncbi:Zn-ribbon domain-containing OB-fold protein [Streptomyces sp. NL15-2K]|uniref:Zn-ribbon domain-containing OB-fold protein n=1 Tax=Streptomyces sp. NL15-2K TaxID=376149 RepID=UPI000F564159|nr:MULTISPECIES: hypothetical protein [Actinomycetes]WKX15752.1 hypothetical protein Q4V64_52955 [Kutzneria buriramensis]GCB43984.1 hypothetical protein SNL152K_1269 [Streptomyces sp. NL15-2K]